MRVGIDASLLEYQSDGAALGTNGYFGGGNRTTLGLATAPVGVLLGYGVSDHALIGARLEFMHRNQSGIDVLGGGLTATLAYVAGKASVRGFVGPLIGIQFANLDGTSYRENQTALTIGAQAGFLAFPVGSFSIDPSISFAYVTGSSNSTSAFPAPSPGGNPDLDGFIVGLRLAVSGWIGGETVQSQPEPTKPNPQEIPQQPEPPQQQPVEPQQSAAPAESTPSPVSPTPAQ